MPRTGWRQRRIERHELIGGHGFAQLRFEHPALARLLDHAGLEAACGVAILVLGPIERDVGRLQQDIRGVAVAWG
jgi:hypothetical protein